MHRTKSGGLMSALGHSRPSHFVPVLNNVRYASDSDHSRYESELTLWAIFDLSHRKKNSKPFRHWTAVKLVTDPPSEA
jgi:hypothetical protein